MNTKKVLIGCIACIMLLACYVWGDDTWINGVKQIPGGGAGSIQERCWPMDAGALYDTETTKRTIALMTLDPLVYPRGIAVQKWVIDMSIDPTTELVDCNLYYSEEANWKTITVDAPTGDTLMDVLDTAAGISSETDPTAMTVSTVPAGATIYILFGNDPTDINVVTKFQLIWKVL
jgi:hypothetical protein